MQEDPSKKFARLLKELSEFQEYFDDTHASEEDRKAYAEYEKAKAAGKLIPHDELKKELGL